MILHGYYRSSAAFRVRIGLNLKGLPYDCVFHHLRKGEQRSPAYLALNPQGLVPSLNHEGQVLVQSQAILEYLEEMYPSPPLLPTDIVERAYVRGLVQQIACDIHPLNNLRVLNRLRGPLGQDEDVLKAWVSHWITLGFEALETTLARDARTGVFCFGDRPGLGDVCLVPQMVNAQNFAQDLAPYPTLRRIFDACMALPAFTNAHPVNQPDADPEAVAPTAPASTPGGETHGRG